MRLKAALLSISVILGLTVVASGDDWPQFRGNGSGIVDGLSLPVAWGQDKNISWKTQIPGVAWSSPVVWGDKVFITTAITDNQYKPGPPDKTPPPRMQPGSTPPDDIYKWEIFCLDRDSGKVIWSQQAMTDKPRSRIAPYNTYATETPVTDGERVYVYFGMHGVFCYDLAGKRLWEKDLGVFPMQQNYGTATSPVLHGDHLFLQIDNEQQSFLVALNKKSGDEVWRVDRDEKSSWGTPIIWKNKTRTELVTPGSRKARSYDPETGKLLWELAGPGGNNTNCPVGDADHLYVILQGGAPGPGGQGGQGGLFAVKAGATGDISLKPGETSNEGVAWSARRSAGSDTSPIAYQQHVYVFTRNGVLTCYDAATGSEVYRDRVPDAKSIWSSPWGNDGRLYILDDAGTTFVLQAGPTFKVLSKNTLNDTTWATPAAAGGAIYLRGVDYLYCIKS